MKTLCSTHGLISAREEEEKKERGTRVWVNVERMADDRQKWSGERAVGTICIQLLWYDKEVCYEHVTSLALITQLACAALIGRDLSTQKLMSMLSGLSAHIPV